MLFIIFKIFKDGCIIKGIKLEGATWNEEGYLTETSPILITSTMPNIHMKPTHVPDNTYFEGNII